MRIVFCIIFLTIPFTRSLCQSWADSTTIFIGSQAHYGFIVPHSKDITHLATSNPWGWQAEISRMRHTQTAWNACNCLSKNGFLFTYFNFDNREVLGSSVNLAFFAEPQFVLGKINLGLRAGIGLSYLSRIYHVDNNPENLFFSNPLSGLIFVQLNGRVPLSEHWSVHLASSYNHISNGGKRQPNKGMNFPMLSVGAAYAINPMPMRKYAKVQLTDRSLHYYGGMFYNTKSLDDLGTPSSKRKAVIGIQAGVYKPFASMHAAGLAVEAVYDAALKEHALQSAESYDHRIVSGLIRHHLFFGRFDFSQALGVYLYKDYPTLHNIFQRYALDYRLLRHLRVGFSMKAHLHTAEQIDLRLTAVF